MIRNIIRDKALLRSKSEPATSNDANVGTDLLDTLRTNQDRCVGMAANMIGVLKNVIVYRDNNKFALMYNPVIVSQEQPFQTEEGCLSLDGTRPTIRYKSIVVHFQNEKFVECEKKFSGFVAQIIQHEIDHCNGIII